jgi:hypothetical protein
MFRVAVMTGGSSGIGYETSFLERNQFAIYGKESLTSMIYKLQEMRLLSIQNH